MAQPAVEQAENSGKDAAGRVFSAAGGFRRVPVPAPDFSLPVPVKVISLSWFSARHNKKQIMAKGFFENPGTAKSRYRGG